MTASTTNRKPTRKPAEDSAGAAIEDGRAITGMDEVFAEVERAVTPPTLRELLLRRRMDVEQVRLDGVGAVTVRGLTREEVKLLRLDDKGEQVDDTTYENRLIAAAMTDPVLTVDDVETWSRCAPAGEQVDVMAVIQRLSGLSKDGAKSGVPAV